MIFTATAVVLAAVALISIWTSRAYSPKAKLIWTAAVVVLPVVGPVAWFALGRVRKGG